MPENTIKVGSVKLDIISNKELVNRVNNFLHDDILDIILYLSPEMVESASLDEGCSTVIRNAELVLPGSRQILESYGGDTYELSGIVVSSASFGIILENIAKEACSVFIISESMDMAEKLKEYCLRCQPEIKIAGLFDTESGGNDNKKLLNEINSLVPDIILLDISPGKQEHWISSHMEMLNAKLMVAIGGVTRELLHSRRMDFSKFHLFSRE
ncbi:MAG: WecB/TagA/CpsF family glycosyltransferase [Lachnospiraceae bacterium]|nr:WecB/TagA/CpsF family glycosyltransferase [Lachnospiraceae bacterium]MEE3460306.1 WecB/TagA/CpsF family glycosyltransferase [Lachnospiraceae bacterium]